MRQQDPMGATTLRQHVRLRSNLAKPPAQGGAAFLEPSLEDIRNSKTEFTTLTTGGECSWRPQEVVKRLVGPASLHLDVASPQPVPKDDDDADLPGPAVDRGTFPNKLKPSGCHEGNRDVSWQPALAGGVKRPQELDRSEQGIGCLRRVEGESAKDHFARRMAGKCPMSSARLSCRVFPIV